MREVGLQGPPEAERRLNDGIAVLLLRARLYISMTNSSHGAHSFSHLNALCTGLLGSRCPAPSCLAGRLRIVIHLPGRVASSPLGFSCRGHRSSAQLADDRPLPFWHSEQYTGSEQQQRHFNHNGCSKLWMSTLRNARTPS